MSWNEARRDTRGKRVTLQEDEGRRFVLPMEDSTVQQPQLASVSKIVVIEVFIWNIWNAGEREP